MEQGLDTGNYTQWEEAGARPCSDKEKEDLIFGNIICKHLKSNAIALVKNKQLLLPQKKQDTLDSNKKEFRIDRHPYYIINTILYNYFIIYI